MSDRPAVLTGRGQAFAALGLLTAVTGMLLGFPDVTRIGVLLLALPLFALLTAWRRAPRIRVTRQVSPPRLRPDERARVQVHFVNVDRPRTPMYLAEERLDYVLGDRPRFILPRLDRGEERRLTYRIRSHVRGRYQLGPVALSQRDPFGLTQVNLLIREHTEVLVLPRVEALGQKRPRGEGRGNEGEVPHMVALHGEDDVSIRSYRDGDDLRRVHWPATAHRGELMVRQEDRPARRRAVLVLDSRQAGHQGTGTASSFEWAVSATASIAVQLNQQGYAAHLVSAETVHDGTASEAIDVNATLTALAVARLEDRHGFEEVVRAAHLLTANGGVVITVVADHDEQALRRLAAIREPGSVGLALVLDTGSFGHAESGRHTLHAGQVDDGPASAAARVLETAGWRTQVVHSRLSVHEAWEAASTATMAGVGR